MARPPGPPPAESPCPLETVVTYLEMRERPPRPPSPPPAGLKAALIRAEEPTVAFYRFLYDTVGAPWTWVERRLMDDEALAAAVRAEGVEVYVLHAAGVPAGYGEVDRRAAPGAVDLAYFGLMPEFIGRGLGRWFVEAMVDIAWSSGPRRVRVHTCDLDHPRALRNYQRAGFVAYNQAVEAVPDPRLAGLPWPERRAAGG